MMIVELAGLEFAVELYDNQAARELAAALPQTLSMSRWGDEYYGRLAVPIAARGGETRRFRGR